MARRRGSKKHLGVKDPFKQQRVRDEKIKNKINNPPKDAGIQEEPRKHKSLRLPLECERPRQPRKQREELLNTAKFIDKDVGVYPHNGRPFKRIPTLKQNPNEANFKFMRRVYQATQMVVKESQFQDKFKVDVKRNKSGQVVKLEPRLTKKMIEKKEQKRLKGKEWSLKKKLKKKGIRIDTSSKVDGTNSNEDDGDDEVDIEQRERDIFRKERVSFDDIVHEPPNLETEKLQAKVKERKKIKHSNFLFLQNLEESDELAKSKEKPSKARQKILEIERERVVLAYRQLQAKKRDASSNR